VPELSEKCFQKQGVRIYLRALIFLMSSDFTQHDQYITVFYDKVGRGDEKKFVGDKLFDRNDVHIVLGSQIQFIQGLADKLFGGPT
jgi:hypothetical protein